MWSRKIVTHQSPRDYRPAAAVCEWLVIEKDSTASESIAAWKVTRLCLDQGQISASNQESGISTEEVILQVRGSWAAELVMVSAVWQELKPQFAAPIVTIGAVVTTCHR